MDKRLSRVLIILSAVVFVCALRLVIVYGVFFRDIWKEPVRRDRVWNLYKARIPDDVSPEHIPDIRIYGTLVLDYPGLREYKNEIRFRIDPLHSLFLPSGIGVAYCNDVKNGLYDYFVYCYLKDPAGFKAKHTIPANVSKKYKKSALVKLKNGLSLERYWIGNEAPKFAYETYFIKGDYYLGFLEVLKDGNETVWLSSKRSFLDVKANDRDKRYTVLTDGGVEYISYENGRLISDRYVKAFTGAEEPFELPGDDPVASGSILTDDIVLIKNKTGGAAHWKTRLTLRDCLFNTISHLNVDKRKSFFKRAEGSIIWHDDKYTADKMQIAWDMDKDTSAEPNYK